jgi:hypothetical protein
MTTDDNGAPAGADQLARVAGLLQQYPNVSENELGELKTWFRRQATALDIGMLASKAEIEGGYARFRKEHIDGFGAKDIATIVAVLVALAGIIALIAYWTM